MARLKPKTESITTLAEYINKVTSIRGDWERAGNVSLFLFRGQPQNWPLLPKIAREKNELSQDAEKILFSHFKRLAIKFLNPIPKNDWDWLSIGQHYGLPTRLLDWTENSLMALWFAVNNIPDAPPIDEHAIVWVFAVPDAIEILQKDKPKKSINLFVDTDTENPLNIGYSKVFSPNHVTSRISAQSGWFTVHKRNSGSSTNGRFVKFNVHQAYKKFLFPIQINYADCIKLQSELDQININHSTVYPDIGGLCSYFGWKHQHK